MSYKILKIRKSFSYFMIIFWSGFAIYFAIELPGLWHNPEYARTNIIIFVIIPSLFFIVAGLLIPFISKVIYTDEYILKRSVFVKKIYYSEITKMDIGENFIKIYKSRANQLTVSWIYENYYDAKINILEHVKKNSEVNFNYVKRYRR